MTATIEGVRRETVNDVCDRHPSARAYTAWYHGEQRLLLTLCAHCAHEQDVALVERGFALTVDDRESLEPQRTTHT